MANFDPSTLAPSETGRVPNTISIADLLSNVPGYHGHYDPARDDLGDYTRLMRLLTQPKRDMGAGARRAAAGMPMEHGAGPDPVELQRPGVGQSLVSLLFGGMK